MFRREWLKTDYPVPGGVEANFASSAYNNVAGQNWDLLHVVALLADESPDAQKTNASPRELREDLKITAVRGNVTLRAPMATDPSPVTGLLLHTYEGIRVADFISGGGGIGTNAFPSRFDPAVSQYQGERWLWKRQMHYNVYDEAGSTLNGWYPLSVLPKTQEEVWFEPKVTLAENETLVYCVRHLVTQNDNPASIRVNTEAAFPLRIWLDLRYLTWNRV